MKSKLDWLLIKCVALFAFIIIGYELLYKAGFTPVVSRSPLFDKKVFATQRQHVGPLRIMTIGSSQALYAINSEMLVGHFHMPYYNLGSWHLQMADLRQLVPVYVKDHHPEYIILCSSIGDFRFDADPGYQLYINSDSLVRNRFPELFYVKKLSSVYEIIRRKLSEKYTDIDDWGGMPLTKSAREIMPDEWKEHIEFPNEKTAGNYKDLDSLAIWIQRQKIRLIFVQPPFRAAYVNTPVDSRQLATHFDSCRSIVQRRGGVYLNYYNTTIFTDSLFFDMYHMQASGGRLMTKELLADLDTIIK